MGIRGVRLSQTWSLMVEGLGRPWGLFIRGDVSSKLFPSVPPTNPGPPQEEKMNMALAILKPLL